MMQNDSYVTTDKMTAMTGLGFPGVSAGAESAFNEGDLGLILEWGRSHGGGHGNPL